MKYFILLLLIVFFRCEETCPGLNSECLDFSIIPDRNVNNSVDLQTYLLKEDSSYLLNGDTFYTEAIKLVPKQGYIDWRANCAFFKYDGQFGLYFNNYGDTTNWHDLFIYAYQREHITIFNFNLELATKQLLVDEDTFNKNRTLAKCIYTKSAGHGDIFDAIWRADLSEESYIELTKIDSVNQILEGNFNLFFKLETQDLNHPYRYAEKAQFKCGKFKAIMFK